MVSSTFRGLLTATGTLVVFPNTQNTKSRQKDHIFTFVSCRFDWYYCVFCERLRISPSLPPQAKREFVPYCGHLTYLWHHSGYPENNLHQHSSVVIRKIHDEVSQVPVCPSRELDNTETLSCGSSSPLSLDMEAGTNDTWEPPGVQLDHAFNVGSHTCNCRFDGMLPQ